MRFLICILSALCALPCVSQDRVFRASSIDTEQDSRLDAVEHRVATLEDAPAQKFSPASMVSKPTAAKPAASKPYAVITIESLPGCEPCNRWKAKEARELRAQGWTVVETSLVSSSSAPFFRICVGDKCYSYRGFMSHASLRAILGRTVRVARQPANVAVQSARYTTAELRVLIHQARPGGWRGAVYADVSPRSMAKQHLVGPEHGFSWDQVSGLSQEEALILHDLAPSHGNKIFPTRLLMSQ